MAILQGVSTADITHLFAWHCLTRRHGLVMHAAAIVMDDLLQEHVAKQIQLCTFKIEILPLLFAGALPGPVSAISCPPVLLRIWRRFISQHSNVLQPSI